MSLPWGRTGLDFLLAKAISMCDLLRQSGGPAEFSSGCLKRLLVQEGSYLAYRTLPSHPAPSTQASSVPHLHGC